jgi:signal transduction histidine kinase
MDERMRDAYFQPFRSAFDEGTGLGAAIVYRLVEEHGGRIDLSSEPGRGTTVAIMVPRTHAGVEDETQGIPAQAAGGRS